MHEVNGYVPKENNLNEELTQINEKKNVIYNEAINNINSSISETTEILDSEISNLGNILRQIENVQAQFNAAQDIESLQAVSNNLAELANEGNKFGASEIINDISRIIRTSVFGGSSDVQGAFDTATSYFQEKKTIASNITDNLESYYRDMKICFSKINDFDISKATEELSEEHLMIITNEFNNIFLRKSEFQTNSDISNKVTDSLIQLESFLSQKITDYGSDIKNYFLEQKNNKKAATEPNIVNNEQLNIDLEKEQLKQQLEKVKLGSIFTVVINDKEYKYELLEISKDVYTFKNLDNGTSSVHKVDSVKKFIDAGNLQKIEEPAILEEENNPDIQIKPEEQGEKPVVMGEAQQSTVAPVKEVSEQVIENQGSVNTGQPIIEAEKLGTIPNEVDYKKQEGIRKKFTQDIDNSKSISDLIKIVSDEATAEMHLIVQSVTDSGNNKYIYFNDRRELYISALKKMSMYQYDAQFYKTISKKLTRDFNLRDKAEALWMAN